MFPKTSGDGETKWMYFLEKNLLEKYNGIWNKVSLSIKSHTHVNC